MAQQITIIPDHCPICFQRIRENCPACGHPTALENHVQFQIKHLPDNLTWVAVCQYCFARMSDEQAKQIFEAIKTDFVGRGHDAAGSWEFIKPVRESAIYEGSRV